MKSRKSYYLRSPPLRALFLNELIPCLFLLSRSSIAALSTTYQSSLSAAASSQSIVSQSPSPSSTTQSPTGPTIVPDIVAPGGVNYQETGCYEDVTGQGYPLIAAYDDGSVNTVDQCISDCSTINGYEYAAIEGDMCWCSNLFDSSANQTPGQCDTPCLGNSAESCGGMRKRTGPHIIVYKARICLD